METVKLLDKKIRPFISYIILGLCLIVSLVIGYAVFTAPLLFFNKNKDQINQPIYPTNREEYREFLLENQSEIIEDFVLGDFTGKPTFTKNVDKFDDILKDVAKKYKINCTLIKATMMAESRGNPKVRSGVGAVGLMQLMSLTAKSMGYASNLTDPRVNIMAGGKYMSHLKERACHEKPKNDVCDVTKDIKFRVAAYNGGPKCNQAGGGECSRLTSWECEHYNGYDQTRNYVNRVKANYKYLKDSGWSC